MSSEQTLIRQLRGIRARIRTLVALHGLGRLLLMLPPAVLGAVLLDYLLHFPWVIRGLLLAGVGAATVAVVLFYLLRPLKVKISVEDVAQELEGRFPDLNDRLATAVNFVTAERRERDSQALREAVIADTLQAVDGMKFEKALRPGPLVGLFAGGLAVTAAVIGLGFVYPAEARLGLERLFNPLSAAEWPKQTLLVHDTQKRVIPIGEDYKLVVGVDPHSRKSPGRVIVYYRDQGADSFDYEVLESLPGGATEQFGYTFRRVPKSFEYYIEGGDDRVPAQGAILVDAKPKPSIENIVMTVTWPDYVKGTAPIVVAGQGSTHALQGSTITLDIVTNKAIGADAQGRPRAELLLGEGTARTSQPLAFVQPGDKAQATTDEQRVLEEKKAARSCLRAAFPLEETTRFNFKLTCADGFPNEPAEDYYLLADKDEAPRVQIVQPTQAIMDVTALSRVQIEVAAKDDYGLSKVELPWTMGSDAQDWKGEKIVALKVFSVDEGTAERPTALGLGELWDLRDITPPLKEGDELAYKARAFDNFNLHGQKPHEASTAVYRLRVVSQKAMEETLRRTAGALGERIGELIQKQVTLQSQTKETRAEKKDAEPLSDQGRDQAMAQESTQNQLKEEDKNLQKEFANLLKQVQDNRLPEDEVFQKAGEMRDALEEVQKDPSGPMPKASASLRDARDAQAKPEQQSQSLTKAVDQMQASIDQLGRALGQLQKVNEANQLAQELRRILAEQEKLTERTRQHALQTLGQSPAQLSPEERQTQQALERRQKELSGDTKAAIDKIKEAAARLLATQPPIAAVLKDAAQEADTRNPARKMENASGEIAQTQYGNAKTNQEAAQEDLKAIIQKLEDQHLAELQDRGKMLEAIKKELGEIQKKEQGHLDENKNAQAGKPDAAKPQDQAPKQEQTGQQTQNLSQKAEQAQSQKAAQSMQQASQKMQQAAQQLSQNQSSPAQQKQEQSLKDLEKAMEEVKKDIEDNKDEQEQEKIEKMKDKLARIRDDEKQVRKATGEIESKRPKLERSDLASLLFNTGKQKTLLSETGDILKQMEEEGVKVYKFALSIAADRMNESHDRLSKSETDQVTQVAQDKAIKILDQLVNSLEEEMSRKKKKGGGGGQQGQGKQKPKLIPTLAELKMLRLMQGEIDEGTVQINEAQKKVGQPTPEVQAEAERLGRDQDKVEKLLESLVDPNSQGAGGQAQ